MHSRENSMFAIARITSNGQTTIPQDIRAALNVSAGDTVAWQVNAEGIATVRRVQPLDIDYFSAMEGTLPEWSSEADEETYREL